MKKLVVKEFDKIIKESSCDKYSVKFHSLPEKTFNSLKKFIINFNSQKSDVDALDLMKIGYSKLEFGKPEEVITIQNYVGLIQMKDGTQIEILPKISFDENQTDFKKTKKIFLKMIKSLNFFSGKVFGTSELNTEKMNLHETFISMYLQEVRCLIKRGVKSSYEKREENLKVYKGKLKTKENIYENFIHKERFYVEFDEYTENTHENKIIKSTLLKLQKISSFMKNLSEIRDLLNNFEFIDISNNYCYDFSKIFLNRKSNEYESLMNWSKIFLYDKSFTTFSGTTAARSILFPMEKLFESYIASEIKKESKFNNWIISTQDKQNKRYLFEETKKFVLRPDIMIKKSESKTVIIDTKWKKLSNNRKNNYGISQSDMYQMYAYSKKYKANKIYLVYPLSKEMIDLVDKDIIFKSDDEVEIQILMVDLISVKDDIKKIINFIEKL